jgi:hypothetical protein
MQASKLQGAAMACCDARRAACCEFEQLEGSPVGNSSDLLGHALPVRDARVEALGWHARANTAVAPISPNSQAPIIPIGPMLPISPMGFQFETPPSKPERSSATLTIT